MNTLHFLIKCGVYILSFVVSMYAMKCINYEKILKKGFVKEAQVLYFLMVFALAYLVGSFFNVFLF